jgi:hypothetical protein
VFPPEKVKVMFMYECGKYRPVFEAEKVKVFYT